MAKIGITDVKTLFALSGNTCAYTGCEERMTDPAWGEVKADMAHICGERPSAPRYDPTLSEAEREAFANRILLCPNHHRLIDRLEPYAHPVDHLRRLKADHEGRSDGRWARDEDLERFARLALAAELVLDDGAPADPLDGRFGTPYGLDRGPGFLTLTVPRAASGDNGSGSLYSEPPPGGTGIVLDALRDLAVAGIGHLLGVAGTVFTEITVRDFGTGDTWDFAGEALPSRGVLIYEGVWNWFDLPVDLRLYKSRRYELRARTWKVVKGAPLDANNWNFLQPFLRDVEGRAFDHPYEVGGAVCQGPVSSAR